MDRALPRGGLRERGGGETMNKHIRLGVIEFHTPQNKALIDDFYHTVNDLRAAGCIVDLWLLDISRVLEKHGYMMTVYKKDDYKPES